MHVISQRETFSLAISLTLSIIVYHHCPPPSLESLPFLGRTCNDKLNPRAHTHTHN